MNQRLEYIIILLLIMLLIVSILTFSRSKNFNMSEEEFYAAKKEALTKKELRDQVKKIFSDISEADKRHNDETNKLKEKLKAILALSLDPDTQLENVPKKVKKEDVCLFNIGGQLKNIKDMYNNYKNNPKFELIHIYEYPILGQGKDFKNKVKTYGYIYVDKTSSSPYNPYYESVSIQEKYGNITLLFDDKCKVIELVSLAENISKENMEYYQNYQNNQNN